MKRFRVQRLLDGIPDFSSTHSYMVINVDEPYAHKVFELIKDSEKAKGTWDGPDEFDDFVRELKKEWEEEDFLPDTTPSKPAPPALASLHDWMMELCRFKAAGKKMRVADKPEYRYLGFKPVGEPPVYVSVENVKGWPAEWNGPYEGWGASYQHIFDTLRVVPSDLRKLISSAGGRKSLIEVMESFQESRNKTI